VLTAPFAAVAPVAAIAHSHNDTRLIVAAVLGIAVVVALITGLRLHPFLALVLGSAVLGAVAGVSAADTVTSFTAGVGSTVGSVGVLIALGAMVGGLLADSGGADRIVTTLVDRVSGARLPWVLAAVAALLGLPLFFEIGVVLLVPIVLLVARRSRLPVLRVGIPALAGLSVLHGLVPPHPGPLAAIAVLHADLGTTLAFGLVIAIPAIVVAGPLFGIVATRFVTARTVDAAAAIPGGVADPADRPGPGATAASDVAPVAGTHPVAAARRSPGAVATAATVLLPVVLMLLRAGGELLLSPGRTRSVLDVIGNPPVALLAGVLVAMVTLGAGSGMGRVQVSDAVARSLPPIAGILLIVAAGGGFKQVLVDAGVGQVIADGAKGAHLSPLILGWLVAVGIRLATGSATVATITAAGIVAPLATGQSTATVALLALAVGSGSLFFSHVNDAGFWLVKEYFGLTVGETLRSWSVMETVISVVGLIGVLVLHLLA
jgi:GntP family gluconate:H+ symporter